MKDRILWLDNLKGFLIIIVILGHTILFTDGTWDKNIVSRYIISFWMYLFMFTSGFASYKSDIQILSIKKRFLQLIIPFITWSLLLSLFNRQYGFFEMLLYPGHSVWFIYALFGISTINTAAIVISQYLKVSDVIINTFIAVILLVLTKVVKEPAMFSLSSISQFYSSYLIGWYLRKYNYIDRLKTPYVNLLFAMVFSVMAFYNKGVFMPFGLPHSLHIGYDMLCGLVSIAFFAPLFVTIFNRKMKLISAWGGNSRFVYSPHICLYCYVLFLSFISYRRTNLIRVYTICLVLIFRCDNN